MSTDFARHLVELCNRFSGSYESASKQSNQSRLSLLALGALAALGLTAVTFFNGSSAVAATAPNDDQVVFSSIDVTGGQEEVTVSFNYDKAPGWQYDSGSWRILVDKERVDEMRVKAPGYHKNSYPASSPAAVVELQASQPCDCPDPAFRTVYTETVPVSGRTSIDVTRLAGSDRQGTAVEISKATFTPNVAVAYIATGAKFPDALSAAPAAAKQGGPLLLVDRDSMRQAVRDELSRLQPRKIVVVGSDASISDSLLNELRAYVPSGDVRRIGGMDRYDTSDKIVRYAFSAGASKAWVATGEKFPDALSASAVAGSADAPVLLVNGGLKETDARTRKLVTDLDVQSVTIAGSALSVSDGIKNSMPTISTRIGGVDRYDTSEKLNKAAFTSADTAYFATGENFPDALAGATAAGFTDSPLFAVHPTCVPQVVLDDLSALGVDKVILLGGPGTLSDAVAQLKPC